MHAVPKMLYTYTQAQERKQKERYRERERRGNSATRNCAYQILYIQFITSIMEK